MHAISSVLLCLACVSLGRRVQTSRQQFPGSSNEARQSFWDAGYFDPSKSLVSLFLGLTPTTGWQALGAGLGGTHPLDGHVATYKGLRSPSVGMPQMSGILESRDLDKLLSENADKLQELRKGAGDDCDELWLLRFVLDNPDDMEAAQAAMKSALDWRQGEGKPLIEAANAAYAEATAGGGWDNVVAFAKAPHSAQIGKFMGTSGSEMITVPTSDGDLCQVIRASAIDDKAMMKEVTVQQIVEFFLYAKELNSLVLNARARATKRLGQVITATDLSGPGGMGQSKDFRTALGETSKRGNALYPLVNGPTILLNLPTLLAFLVGLFKPLFPKKVQAKIKFRNGPLKDVTDLKSLLEAEPRAKFVKELEAIL